jgi:hypothetical protein
MSGKRQSLTAEEFIARLDDDATLRNLDLRDADLSRNVAESLTLRDCRFANVTFIHVDRNDFRPSPPLHCRFLATGREYGCRTLAPHQSKNDVLWGSVVNRSHG